MTLARIAPVIQCPPVDSLQPDTGAALANRQGKQAVPVAPRSSPSPNLQRTGKRKLAEPAARTGKRKQACCKQAVLWNDYGKRQVFVENMSKHLHKSTQIRQARKDKVQRQWAALAFQAPRRQCQRDKGLSP